MAICRVCWVCHWWSLRQPLALLFLPDCLSGQRVSDHGQTCSNQCVSHQGRMYSNQCVSDQGWMCSNQTLFTDTEHWFSYILHLSPNILLFIFSPKCLKMWENTLSLQAVQKQLVGQIWPMDHCLPTLELFFGNQKIFLHTEGKRIYAIRKFSN